MWGECVVGMERAKHPGLRVATVKECIVSRLRDTARPNIERVIRFMEENEFFTLSGRGHHKYPGGLAEHTWQTFLIAIKMQIDFQKSSMIDQNRVCNIAISTLLHELCYCTGMPHIKGHGSRTIRILDELDFGLTLDEYVVLRFHMRVRDDEHQNHPYYAIARGSQFRKMIHKADILSAKIGKGSDYNFWDKK